MTLSKSPQIYRLAQDLRLRIKPTDDPVAALLSHCERQIKSMLEGVTDCYTLAQLLDWVANKVSTSFEMIASDEALSLVQSKYVAQSEMGFVALDQELSGECFGITFKRSNREPWEPQYVSVIDSRGEKAARVYFTKWHEIAHLLTQTDQMRLVFRRTHSSVNHHDPEEQLMEVIAATVGFYEPLVHRFIDDEISFDAIENLRAKLCPEASKQSALINFPKRWISPVVLIRAELGFKKDEEARLNQGAFDFTDTAQAVLRAVHVTPNELARKSGLMIHQNMRVPVKSIIHTVFDQSLTYGESEEDLSWWESHGKALCPYPIKVKARRTFNGVDALIIPA